MPGDIKKEMITLLVIFIVNLLFLDPCHNRKISINLKFSTYDLKLLYRFVSSDKIRIYETHGNTFDYLGR